VAREDSLVAGTLRALTLNLFAQHGNWPARRAALRTGLAALRPDVLTLQEAIVGNGYDSALDVLGDGYAVAHQTQGLVGDGSHRGASVASRWPIAAVHEVDLHLTPRTGDYASWSPATAPAGRGGPRASGNGRRSPLPDDWSSWWPPSPRTSATTGPR